MQGEASSGWWVRTRDRLVIAIDIRFSRTYVMLAAFSGTQLALETFETHFGGDRERFGQDGAWEQTFFYSAFNGANVDIGHYWAGNNTSPLPFIEGYAHRITNLHIKDRKMDNGPDVFWGEGDSQVAETLRFMRDKGYTFQATIELDHPIPAGSDVLTELRRVIDFARRALNA